MRQNHGFDAIDVWTAAVTPAIATIATLAFSLPYLFSILLFYGLPGLIIGIRHQSWMTIGKSAFFAIITSIPVGVVVDYVGTSSGIWYVPRTLFPIRFVGLIPFEDLLWLSSATFFILVEFLSAAPSIELLEVDHRLAKYSAVAYCIAAVLVSLAKSHPAIAEWSDPYAYLALGLLVFAFPSTVILTLSRVEFSRTALVVASFLYATVAFEISATILGQWSFPGHYSIPPLNFFGISSIPIEELVFVGVFGPLTTIALYRVLGNSSAK
jgi:hypothetical protein